MNEGTTDEYKKKHGEWCACTALEGSITQGRNTAFEHAQVSTLIGFPQEHLSTHEA